MHRPSMELLRRAPESCQHVTTAAAATRAAYRVFATVATPTGGDNSDRIAALRKAARSKIAETDAAARAKPVQYSTSVRGVRHVVAVGSGKGGVGKSTVAVNLALGLSALGLRCGLLDADIHGPSIPRLMNLQGRPEVGPDHRLVPLENYGLQVMSIGFLLPAEDPDTPVVWRSMMVNKALQQLLHEVAWRDLDVLVVDLPPARKDTTAGGGAGTGDTQLTIAQRARISGAVVVSTPQEIALMDVKKGIRMFQKLGVPILGMVENMNCGQSSQIFGVDGARMAAHEFGVDFLGTLPLLPLIREASDSGLPLTYLPTHAAHLDHCTSVDAAKVAFDDTTAEPGRADSLQRLRSLLTQLEAEADAGNWHQASALLQPLGSLVHGRLPRADEAASEGADGDAMVGVRSMYMAIAEQVQRKLIT